MENEITQEQIQDCANNLTELCRVMNSIEEEVLTSMLRDMSREQAIGPLLDPTLWRDENLFDKSNKTGKVIRAILDFKKEVKGIGFFK